MNHQRLITVASLCLSLSGCQAVHRPAATHGVAAHAGPDITLCPSENPRRAREQAAMRGVRYEGGVVVVDNKVAATIAARGTRAQGLAEAVRGEELLEQDDQLGAIAAFTRAVIIAPDEPAAYIGLGRALSRRGKTHEAVAAFDTAVGLDPGLVDAWVGLGHTLHMEGRLAESLEAWHEVLRLSPEHVEAHCRLAIGSYYLGDEAQAWKHVNAAQALGGRVPAQFLALLEEEPAPLLYSVGSDRPFVGPQIRIDVNGGEYAVNETSLASLSGNAREIVAAWNDYRGSPGEDYVRCAVGVSSDGGATWTDFLLRPPPPYQSAHEGDPMTCYDNRTGTLWVGGCSFLHNGCLYVARKLPGRNAFEPTVLVRAHAYPDKGWMTAGVDPYDAHRTRLYISYNRGLTVSTDMGRTWSAPEPLAPGFGWLPRVGPNGELYICSWNWGDGVTLQRSFDGGNTISGPIRIATRMDYWAFGDGSRFPGWFRAGPMSYLAVDPVDGTLYCVYFDTTEIVDGNANVDLYFTRSEDRGTTWTTPRVMNGDATPPGDQFFPWLEVDRRGRIQLVFFDSRHTVQDDNCRHGMLDAYYAYSDDAGDSWMEIRLTPASFDSADVGLGRPTQCMGDYCGLGVGGNRTYPCYQSTQNGDSDIFIHVITDPTIVPDSFRVTAGRLESGTTADLWRPDERRVVVWPASRLSAADPAPRGMARPVESVPVFEASCAGEPGDGTERLIQVVARAQAYMEHTVKIVAAFETFCDGDPGDGIEQRFELFNYAADCWETLDRRQPTDGENVVVVTITSNASRFLRPGSGVVEARIGWYSRAARAVHVALELDEVTLTVTPAYPAQPDASDGALHTERPGHPLRHEQE